MSYLDEIKRLEGYTPKASWDYKQHSVGYGTRAKFPGEVIDQAEAERRFSEEAAKARALVDRFAPQAPDGVKNALTSLTYNAGGDWMGAGLGQAIQSGDYAGAKDRFLQYTRAGGQVLPGLVARRNQEAAWFDGGDRMALGGPAPDTRPADAPLAMISGIGRESAPSTGTPPQTTTVAGGPQDFNDPQLSGSLAQFGEALGKMLSKAPPPPTVQMARASRPNINFQSVAKILASRAKPGSHGGGGRGIA